MNKNLVKASKQVTRTLPEKVADNAKKCIYRHPLSGLKQENGGNKMKKKDYRAKLISKEYEAIDEIDGVVYLTFKIKKKGKKPIIIGVYDCDDVQAAIKAAADKL